MTEIDLKRTSGLCTPGYHTFFTQNIEEKQGAQGPYWLFTLRCVDQGEDYGKMVWHRISLSPQSRWVLDQALDAYQMPDTGKAQMPDFFHKYVRAQTYHGEYEGRPQDEINVMLPVSPDFKPPETTTTQHTTPQELSGGRTDDEIPF